MVENWKGGRGLFAPLTAQQHADLRRHGGGLKAGLGVISELAGKPDWHGKMN